MNIYNHIQSKVYANDPLVKIARSCYNTGVNHIKSDGLLSQHRHPFSTYDRGVDTMSDHTPTQEQFPNIPYGYCHCGCGQKTKIAKRTRPEYGQVRGRPSPYLRGHVRRGRKYDTAPWTERFWHFVTVGAPDACWHWQGAHAKSGYGQLRVGDSAAYAHRLSYEIHKGPIPDGMYVLHTCDTRTCVNPAHLFLGTHLDNIADMVTKKRHTHGVTNPGAKLTEADVLKIRKLFKESVPPVEIAQRFGVSRRTVLDVASYHTWRHLP